MFSFLCKCVSVCVGRGVLESYIEMKLIGPVADNFVLRCPIPDLVLVDLVATGGVSVLVEQHRVSCNAWNKTIITAVTHKHKHAQTKHFPACSVTLAADQAWLRI